MSETSTRTLASSGSPFENTIGFSRAIKVGNQISVSGTAPIATDGGTDFPGDLYGQTLRCLDIINDAIETLGGKLEYVTRTRIFLTDIDRWEEAAKAHGQVFADIRPASTFVEVSRLINPEWLVEIEAEAFLPTDES